MIIGLVALAIQIIVTTALGYTSRVYRAVTFESVSVEKVHRQKAVGALATAAAFLKLREAAAAADGWTEDAKGAARQGVHDAFVAAGMDSTEAWALTANVLQPGKAEVLDYEAFSNLSSSLANEISIQDVSTHTKLGEPGTKVSPAPELHPTH